MTQQRPSPIASIPVRAEEDEWSGRALLRAGVGLLALEAAFAAMIFLAANPPVPRRPVVRIALTKPSQPYPHLAFQLAHKPAPKPPAIPKRQSPPVVLVALPVVDEPRPLQPRSLLLDGQENGSNGDPRRVLTDRLLPSAPGGAQLAERSSPSLAADPLDVDWPAHGVAERSLPMLAADALAPSDEAEDFAVADIAIPAVPQRDALDGQPMPPLARTLASVTNLPVAGDPIVMSDGSADLVLAEISIPPLPRRERLDGPAPRWRERRNAGMPQGDRLLADTLGLGFALSEGYGFEGDPDQELPPMLPVPPEPAAPEAQVATATPESTTPESTGAPTVEELSELFAVLDGPMFKNGQVPNVFLDRLPDDLADEPETRRRKQLFLRTLLPLIVQANDRNLAWRAEIERVDAALADGGDQDPDIVAAEARLLAEFRLDSWDHAELMRRADVVPPSLALAQAATESGWGRSSFAREGNSLFGQREFTVTQASDGKKVPRLRRFDDLGAAVAAYVRNLNTHPAYAEFRRARAALRATGRPASGPLLVSYLVRYSERGTDYTRYIQGIMRTNDLAAFDRSRLRNTSLE